MAVCYRVFCKEHLEDLEIDTRELDQDEDLVIGVGQCAQCIEDAREDGASGLPTDEVVKGLESKIVGLTADRDLARNRVVMITDRIEDMNSKLAAKQAEIDDLRSRVD